MNILVALSFLVSVSTFAASSGGSSVRGGGNDLVATFVSTAERLLLEVNFDEDEKKYLSQALKNVRIKSVSVLLDSGEKVANQEKLVAWGEVGLIQLKEMKAGEDSFELMIEHGRPIAHIVIHELFRASGWANKEGRSVDDQFEISIGRYHLNKRFDDTRSMWLYAQCDIKSCGFKGPAPKEDAICEAGYRWNQSTLQLFKYKGNNPSQEESGFMTITNFKVPLENRFGFQVLDNVRIKRGVRKMTVHPLNRDFSFRDFTIEYSKDSGEITKGHAKIGLGKAMENGAWKDRWVVLEMECQTESEFLRKN